jgi:RHS repeat-associated protein
MLTPQVRYVVRILVATFLITIPIAIFAASVPEEVLAPQKLNVVPGQKAKRFSFAAKGTDGTGVLTIKNGDGKDLSLIVCTGKGLQLAACNLQNVIRRLTVELTRPEKLEVLLNDKVVAADWKPQLGVYTSAINVKFTNQLDVILKGIPGSSVTISVTANIITKASPPPVPKIAVNLAQGFVPLAVSANAFQSTGAVPLTAYEWNFGDGVTGTGSIVNHVYTVAGSYVISLKVTDANGISASATQNILVLQNHPPVPVLKITSAITGLVPFIASFDGVGTTDPEGQALKFDWNFGDGATSLNSGPQTTHQYQNAGTYTVTMTVTDILGATAQAQVQVTATAPVLPPDPKDIAPVLTSNEQMPFYDSVRFLTEGTNPVQKNVDLSQLDENRASVLRGKVFDDGGQPLSAVKVRVLNHPEFGETLTRADGQFDLIVNGGGYLTVLYELPGYLSSSRQIEVSFKDYFFTPDVVLAKLDSVVTTISLSAPTVQAVSGTMSRDSSGDRTPTIVIPSGTSAQLVLQDGSTKNVSSLSLRITEYTKGENGPKRMPADLPAGIAYTHAVELTADEAIAQNAKHIQFNKPVSYYVDNFLNAPIGAGVPLGILNPDTKLWEGQADGVVLKILSVQNGVASIDLKGQNQPATLAELTALNFSNEELAQLGKSYQSGQSLWRVQTNHFSAIDLNFLDNDILTDAVSLGEPVSFGPPKTDSCTDCGSVIDVHRASLKERIKTAVLPFDLWYSSESAQPKTDDMRIRVPLVGPTVTADLTGVDYEIQVAGQKITGSATLEPNASVEVMWDGKDGYGRPYPYQVVAKTIVRQSYKRDYKLPAAPAGDSWDGQIGPALITFGSQRAGLTLDHNSTVQVGTNTFGEKFGVNGWTPSILHSFNPDTKTLHLGTGDSKVIDETMRSLVTIAGAAAPGAPTDGTYAFNSPIGSPIAITTSPDGGLYYADSGSAKVLKIDTDGYISTIAGSHAGAMSGDEGPALNAGFTSISKIAVGVDGSIFVVDKNAGVIRKITPDGIIHRIAGAGGNEQIVVDNVPALQVRFGAISGIVASKDGSLFISDGGNNVIYKMSSDGILHRIAGTGTSGNSGNDGPAINAQFAYPIVADIGSRGELYVSDYSNNSIRIVEPSGTIHNAIGALKVGLPPSVDGTSANIALINGRVTDVKVARNGNIYFLDDGGILKRINSLGLLETLSRRNTADLFEPGVTAGFSSESMALLPDGSVLFADTSTKRLRKIGQVFIGNDPDLIQIASQEGEEIYQFSVNGRHLRTLFAKTGKVKWQFIYDSSGLLSTIADADGRPVRFERDTSGRVSGIVNKYGQVIAAGADPNGWLNFVQLPSGENYQFQYGVTGLLSKFTSPSGATSSFAFDASNNLVSDTDALGASKMLSKTNLSDGYKTTITYPDGTFRAASSRTFAARDFISEVTERNGLTSTATQSNDGQYSAVVSKASDGTNVTVTKYPDPRLGGSALYETSTYYNLGWKTNQASKQVILEHYDPSNLFNFRLREVVKPDYNSQIPNTTTYDSATQQWNYLSASGRTVAGQIDAQERPVVVQQGNLLPVQISYDSFGHVAKVTQGDRVSTFAYDSKGYLASLTDPLLREHRFTNDLVGRTTQQVAPSGDTVDFTYDKNSNLTGIHPFGKDWHQLVYNIVDLFSVYQAPAVGSENSTKSYTYNLSRDLQKVTRADGKEIIYGYDVSKARLTSLTMALQTIGYAYEDYGGNLTKATNSDNGSITNLGHTGDHLAQWYEYGLTLPNSVRFDSMLRYTWDRFGNISALDQSGSGMSPTSVQYTYDVDQLMKSAGDLQITRSTNTSLVTGTSLGAFTDAYSYNAYGEVAGYQSGVYSFTVQRDALGRIVQKSETTTDGSVTYSYSYDLNDRLAQVMKDGVVTAQYSYDGNGNRVTVVAGGQQVVSTFDNQDRIIQRGSVQYVFNTEGELQQKTDGTKVTKYQYGLFGQLRTVQLPSGSVITYDTNGLGLRIGKRVGNVFMKFYQWQSATQLAAEVGPSGNLVARFVYGTERHSPDYMLKDGVNYRFIKDHLGSIRFVMNAADGSVAQKIVYDEWGKVISDSNPGFQPFGFGGGLYDADTGFVRFGARDYDPETGRWTSKDPILFNGGINLYRYNFNDPVNFVDVTGRNPVAVALEGAELGAEIGTALFPGGGTVVGTIVGATVGAVVGEVASETLMNWFSKQDKKLSKGEINNLKDNGIDPHDLKPRKNGSKFDLFKRPNGDICVKPKSGIGPGEDTGININDISKGIK